MSDAADQVMGSTELVLSWIGFGVAKQRELLMEELGEELEDFLQTTPKELENLAKTLNARTVANRKVSIGLQRMKKLKGVIFWAKDRLKIDMPVTVDSGFDNATAKAIFLAELSASTARHFIRERTRDSQETRAKNASPGKLKDEGKWDKWEGGLIIMLGILQGVNDVPLSYVIREEEHKDGDVYDNFVDKSIARAKLEGPEFDADARLVHQLLQSLTIGENAEHWLKDLSKKHNGRKDMLALRNHYRGAGNQSRRINAAQKLQNTLHYKNERAMPFSLFISQVQNMFNIFEECNEPQAETQKLRFLFQKSESTHLQSAIAAMKAQLGQDETCWTFVAACDHLASQIPADGGANVKFSASALGSHPGDAKSLMWRDGKIHTGFYSQHQWFEILGQDERTQILAERAKGGNKNKKKSFKGKGNDEKTNRKIKSLERALKKKDKRISGLQRSKSDDDEEEESESENDNAGGEFGGRKGKERAKKKQKKN
jgi:hypothetical protein